MIVWNKKVWLGALVLALCGCSPAMDENNNNNNGSGVESEAASTSERASDKQGGSLAMVTARLKVAAVSAANRDDQNGYKYAATLVTRRGDFNGDGNVDPVVLISTCEIQNCHPTTASSVISLLENKDGKFVEILQFEAATNPIVQRLVGGSVVVRSAAFGPNDPHCCPEEIHTQTVTISLSGGVKMHASIKESGAQPFEFTTETAEIAGDENITEQSSILPSAFQGTWDESSARCALEQGLSDTRLIVTSNKVKFYESIGVIQNVRLQGDQIAVVTASYSGEGETWKDTDTLRLDGESLYIKDFKRVRCN